MTMLPTYLHLEKGRRDLARALTSGGTTPPRATFDYSGKFDGDYAILANGIYELPHPDNPHRQPWSGDFGTGPQTLDIEFPHARTVDRVLVFGPGPTIPFRLLDYDLQYHDGAGWKTIQEVRAPCRRPTLSA